MSALTLSLVSTPKSWGLEAHASEYVFLWDRLGKGEGGLMPSNFSDPQTIRCLVSKKSLIVRKWLGQKYQTLNNLAHPKSLSTDSIFGTSKFHTSNNSAHVKLQTPNKQHTSTPVPKSRSPPGKFFLSFPDMAWSPNRCNHHKHWSFTRNIWNRCD